MKKFLFSSIVLLFCTTIGLMAAPITKDQALEIALKKFQEASFRNGEVASSSPITIDYVYHKGDAQRGIASNDNNGEAYFYVLNRGQGEGFALVAADDKIPAVLAYSLTGKFRMENLPDNLRLWLQVYEQEIESILSGEAEAAMREYKTEGVPENVEALMDTGDFASDPIKWNQDYPWNNKEPLLNGQPGYTGCVATAIAQIMRYYKWPLQAEGAFNYHAGSIVGNWSGTFGDTYDWDNMPGSPNLHNLSNAQVDAYSTFMRDVSASVNMQFYADGSGTYSMYVIEALRNNFHYKHSARMHVRAMYNAQEWSDMIRHEISEGRPIYYSGNNQSVGHAFVCDGYASDNTFHFNWGWAGNSNGYYMLTLLSPTSLGIGGQGIGFTIYQEIILGIEPAKTSQEIGESSLTPIGIEKLEAAYSKGMGLEISYLAHNMGELSSEIDFGYRIEKANGDIIEEKYSSSTISWTGYGEKSIEIVIPANKFSQGINTVTLMYRKTGSNSWSEMEHFQGGVGNKIFVDTNQPDDQAVTILDNSGTLKIIPASLDADLNSFEQSHISVNLINSSSEEIRRPLMFGISSKGNNYAIKKLGWVMAEVPGKSEDYPITFSTNLLTVEEGEYILWYRLSVKDDMTWKKIGYVTVKTPTTFTHPQLKVSHDQASAFYNVDMSESRKLPPFSIKNVGLRFKGVLIVYLEANLTSDRYWVGAKNVWINQGETYQYEPFIDLNIPGGVKDGFYKGYIQVYKDGQQQFYVNGDLYYNIKIVNGTAVEVIEQPNELCIYPNPAQNFIQISAPSHDNGSPILLFDMNGRIVKRDTLKADKYKMIVTDLPNGVYIIKIGNLFEKIIVEH